MRTIRAATLAEQAAELIRVGTVPRTTAPADVERMLTAAGWTSWAPADDHGLWDDLVKAFDDVGGAFGGVPKIERILFFQTAYKYDTSNRGAPEPGGAHRRRARTSAARRWASTSTDPRTR